VFSSGNWGGGTSSGCLARRLGSSTSGGLYRPDNDWCRYGAVIADFEGCACVRIGSEPEVNGG